MPVNGNTFTQLQNNFSTITDFEILGRFLFCFPYLYV